MEGIQISNRDLRLNYENAIRMIAEANLPAGQPRTQANINAMMAKVNLDELTQGYIRSEVTLQVNQQTLQFPIVDTQNIQNAPITPTMKLLAEQDSFVVSHLGFWLELQDPNNTGAPYTGQNMYAPLTFPDAWTNHSGYPFPTIDPGMIMMWRSFLSIEVNKKTLIPQWDMMRHFVVPDVQSTQSLPAPNVPNPNYTPSWSAHNGATTSYYPFEPNIVLGGGRQNVVKLNLPQNIPDINPMALTQYNNTIVCKAVLVFRGILAQNSTNIR